MKKSIWVVHAIGICEDCGKEFVNYKNAQALAARHAKVKKHKVSGDIGLTYEYDGRE